GRSRPLLPCRAARLGRDGGDDHRRPLHRPVRQTLGAVAGPEALPGLPDLQGDRGEGRLPPARGLIRPPGRASGGRGHRVQMAAFDRTGWPRSLVVADSTIRSPSRHIEVTTVTPGNTTPVKRTR